MKKARGKSERQGIYPIPASSNLKARTVPGTYRAQWWFHLCTLGDSHLSKEGMRLILSIPVFFATRGKQAVLSKEATPYILPWSTVTANSMCKCAAKDHVLLQEVGVLGQLIWQQSKATIWGSAWRNAAGRYRTKNAWSFCTLMSWLFICRYWPLEWTREIPPLKLH